MVSSRDWLGIRDEKGNIFFQQVWFPGNHADIGGGYEENDLAYRTLAFNGCLMQQLQFRTLSSLIQTCWLLIRRRKAGVMTK